MQPLNRFIDPAIITHAEFLRALTMSVRTRLPASVAEHCWVGGIRGDTLVVVTNSGNRTIPLRYQQHELLKLLNSEFQTDLKRALKRLKIIVTASQALLTLTMKTPGGGKNPISPAPLTTQNARQLLSVASAIADSELRSALLKLASRRQATK
jgi:hypothetical protein